MEKSTAQIDTAQIGSSQTFGRAFVSEINTSKISFPSLITFHQFFRSHNHNFDYHNTTVPTWTEFLKETTSFNLNIKITNLSNGQLADTQITEFDRHATPIAGTLTLDIGGNGLG